MIAGKIRFAGAGVLDRLGGLVIVLRMSAKDRIACLRTLVQLLCDSYYLGDAKHKDIIAAILRRERLGTTGVGNGVAIPHAKDHRIDSIYIVLSTLSSPIDFESIDDKPVDIVFLLVAPETAGADHLKVLHRFSTLLRAHDVRTALRAAVSLRDSSAILQDVFDCSVVHEEILVRAGL